MARGLLLFLLPGFTAVCLQAQTGETRPDTVPTRKDYGTINGRVTDPAHGALRGARIELQPRGLIAVSENEGQFTIPGVPPGTYTLTISYIGFAPFSTPITVTPGGENEVDALLHIGSVNQEVVVRGEREHGEIEALNRERTADTIMEVLPAEVITSLPNTMWRMRWDGFRGCHLSATRAKASTSRFEVQNHDSLT